MTFAKGFIFLAAAFTEQVEDATRGPRLGTRDMLLAASIMLLLAVGLFAWVYFRFRRKHDRVDQRRISQLARSIDGTSGTSGSGERQRKRRRRRAHRPRNPSLDNTGGLPPPRSDDQLPKF